MMGKRFSWRGALLVSFCNAIIITLLSYVINNWPLHTGENLNHYAWLEYAKYNLGFTKKIKPDSVLFVNVAFDKQLVTISEYDMEAGNTPITDRKKLLTFLQLLHKTNSYKYIFLDVRFEKGHSVPSVDSLLFSEILSMDRIVVADHEDITIADARLLRKTGINDFKSTIVETNFSRYKYSYGGKKSLPLFAYSEITGKTISDYHGIYMCDGHLCYNSLFLNFPVDSLYELSSSKKQYYNLGSDILNCTDENELFVLAKGKYVVIGDMINDVHDTYAGVKPGSVITFYAFKMLMENKHFVSYAILLFWAIVYFSISVSQFSTTPLFKRLSFLLNTNSDLLQFMFSFVEYTLILLIIEFLLYLCFDITAIIILPSTYFAIQKTIINYIRTKK